MLHGRRAVQLDSISKPPANPPACALSLFSVIKAYQPIPGHRTNTVKFVFILSQGVTDHVITF